MNGFGKLRRVSDEAHSEALIMGIYSYLPGF
jgi:hypothetical protein